MLHSSFLHTAYSPSVALKSGYACLLLLFWSFANLHAAGESPADASQAFIVATVLGGVTQRDSPHGRIEIPRAGTRIAPKTILQTGRQGGLEIVRAEISAIWRLGANTELVLQPSSLDAAILKRGTLFLHNHAPVVIANESVRVHFSAGTWMLQAVTHGGFKVICLDGEGQLHTTRSSANSSAPNPIVAAAKIRPGQLLFVPPHAEYFSPIVELHLLELLATSRLLNHFPAPLPNAARLQLHALAQRERLTRMTNATVGDATSTDTFELHIPTNDSGR